MSFYDFDQKPHLSQFDFVSRRRLFWLSFFEKLIQMLLHSTSVKSALAILKTSVLDPKGATNQRYAVPRIPGVFFNYITGAIAHACAQQDARENMWGEVCFVLAATTHMRKCYHRCAGCVHDPDSVPQHGDSPAFTLFEQCSTLWTRARNCVSILRFPQLHFVVAMMIWTHCR